MYQKGLLQQGSGPGLPVTWHHCGSTSASTRQALTGHLARWAAHLSGGCCNLGSPSRVSGGTFISFAPHINLGRLRGCWSLPANASGCKVPFPQEQNAWWISSRVLCASLRHPEDVQGGRQGCDMAVAQWAVAVCTDVAAQAGIWRGCDLLFPNLWLGLLLLVMCETLL